MYVKEVWRYPVKSAAGESITQTEILPLGLRGDRIVLVRKNGKTITSRTHPRLLGLQGTLGPGGVPFLSGHRWDSPEARELVRAAAGAGAELVPYEGAGRFDVLPLLVATDGAIDAFGRDGRRLRPNIVLGGVEGLAERSWQGRRLIIGDVVVGIHDLRGRCIMTTFDPDTLEHDPSVLRDIVKRFGGKLALNCEVLAGGVIAVGQEVKVAA